MATVQPPAPSRQPAAPAIPPPSPSAAAPDAQPPVTSRSSRKLPRPGTFSHARLQRASSTALPRGRSFHGGKSLSPAAQAARDGYFARKAAKLYAERRKATAVAPSTTPCSDTSAPTTQPAAAPPPPALQPSNHNDRDVEVINITVDGSGFKIDDQKKMRTTSSAPSRKNSRAKMTRSSSRQRNCFNRPPEDKENLITDARLEAQIEAYFNRKRAGISAANGAIAPPAELRQTENSCTSNHSWDGSMPKRRNSHSVIQRDHAINQRTSAVKPSKAAATATSPLPKSLHQSHSNEGCEPNHHVRHAQATQSTMTLPNESNLSTNSSTTQTVAHTDSSEQTEGQCAGTQLPSSGKWCDECAGVGLHISALLSELEAHRSGAEGGTNSGDSNCCSSSGSKKGWKSMVTQTVLGDSKSRSASEKTRLVQQIDVLRATVDFLYKKIERMENGNNDNASATSGTSR